jgi:hypothetical protein
MYVKLLRIGTGSDLDPLRVPAPVYQEVEEAPDGSWAIVWIPDANGPPDMPTPNTPAWAHVGGRDVLTSLPPGQAVKWWAHLDARYHKPGMKFRPATP